MLTCNQRSKAHGVVTCRTNTACGEGSLACISETLIDLQIMNADSSTITQHEKLLIGDVPENDLT